MDVRSARTTGCHSHTIRRAIVTVAVALGMVAGSVAVAPVANAAPAVTATPVVKSTSFKAGPQRAFDIEMIRLINDARTSYGLAPVREAQGLTDLSIHWSRYMLGGGTSGRLAHNPKAWTDVLVYGAKNRLAWGENVGTADRGTVAAKALFNAYMKSPGHRANILSTKYHFIGMGSYANAGRLYNTMEFTDRVESLTATKKAPVAKKAVRR